MKYCLVFEYFDFDRPAFVMAAGNDFTLSSVLDICNQFDCEFRRCVVYDFSTLELECTISF